MELESARALLGLGQQLSAGEIERAFASRKEAAEQRLAGAPTETLKAKYKAALEELEQAHGVLQAALRPAPHLSQTQLGDLPGAQPIFTRMGSTGAPAAGAALLLEVGQVLASRYEIREKIGAGGMGGVYRAYDRNRGEEIALKVLLPHLLSHPTARERFVAEAKISSKLSHPNIVNVFDVQRDGEHDFLTMELLRGQTLRQWMAARKAARQPFTVKEALGLAAALGAALGYAHKHTVHRDVKPENVWVEEDGSYKLMDFGIARLLNASQMTETRAALGTAYYMAPEQLRGARDVDGRADQYSLAVMLYEMLSGEIPAGRIRPLRTLNKEVPRSTSRAIDRALDPHPTARFATMEEFVGALSQRGSAIAGVPAWMLVAAASVVLVVGAGVMFWPQIRGWLPDPAGEQMSRNQAIEAQGAIEAQLKRIEQTEREIDTQLRDAKAVFDRIDGMVRMARTEAEKEDAANRLRDAKAQLALWTEIRTLTSQHVFRSDALTKVRSHLTLGTPALRDGRPRQAAPELLSARKAVDALLAMPNAIRDAVLTRGQFDSAAADLKQVAAQERRDVGARLDAAAAASTQAEALFKEAKFDEASKLFGQAARDAIRALNTLIDDLVNGYTAFVNQAIGAGRHEEAGIALRRAKALAALKRSEPTIRQATRTQSVGRAELELSSDSSLIDASESSFAKSNAYDLPSLHFSGNSEQMPSRLEAKKLRSVPQVSAQRMEECNQRAGERRGEERKQFMAECLKD